MSKLAPRKIGIDCRLSGNTHAGIGRYIEELILRLPALEPQKEWVFFFAEQKQVSEYLKKTNSRFKNIKLVIAPIKHYSLAEQWRLPMIFAKEKLDLLHVPHFNVPLFYRGRLVVTIHDLLWHEFVGLQVTTLKPHIYFLKYLAYRLTTRIAVSKANVILVPAQTIKAVVAKYYPWAKAKIKVTTEGFSQEFAPKAPKKLAARPVSKLLIYVGSLYPHKNIEVVLKALPNLPDYQLQIVGARNVFQDQARALVKKYQVEDQVTFAGYLEDQKLKTLMDQALALVQPSLSEGFGLTGVEAMAAGLPVLASDIPIFKEIYQDGAIFFDPSQAHDFVQAVEQLEKTNRTQLAKKGQQVVSQYSWEEMADQTLAVYNSI